MSVTYKTNQPLIDQYFNLFETTGWNKEYCLNKDELNLSLSNSYYTVSVYEDNKLVGFGRIVSDGVLHAMVYEMIVDPDYQGEGIGSTILNMMVDKCLENNIRDIQLFCARGKKSFYERHGFTVRDSSAPGMQYNRDHRR
ncbi:MAG: GNAT family N-acetyltransferase [Ignavibacteriaceae bacterium]|nr:GNAT family N-acetyltransferase [Ignavibacteriaceae bacterium]